MWNLLSSWLGLGGLGLGAAFGAAWFFGLMPVLGAAAQVAASVLAPILGAAVQGLVWVWQNVVWRGLRDILDDGVTVITVAVMAVLLWGWLAGTYEVRVHRLNKDLGACQTALVKAKRTIPKASPEPDFKFKWPWE